VRGALRGGNQGGMLWLQLGVFKVRSWAVGQSDAAGFTGGVVRLKRRGRRAMIGGAHLLARRDEAGAPSYDGGKNWVRRWRSTWSCCAERGRWLPGKEWAGTAGWANSVGKKKKSKEF
jgi:hypothetical protein